VNVTFEGCPVNFTVAKSLGCSFEIDNFVTEINNGAAVVIPDPAYMCKLIRNVFGEKRKMTDENDEVIDFIYLEKLNELQENEGLNLANQLRIRHMLFFQQKIKVKLATQLLTRSVAEALLFCRDYLNLENFQDCGATVRFISLVNHAFNILNSKQMSEFGFKKPLNINNSSRLFHLKNSL
jgi:hypothetical protein